MSKRHTDLQIVFGVDNGRGSMSLFSLEMWFKGLFDMSSEHLDIMTPLESANVDFHEKSS